MASVDTQGDAVYDNKERGLRSGDVSVKPSRDAWAKTGPPSGQHKTHKKTYSCTQA